MRILLKLFSSFNDTFNGDAVHSQQSLIRSGLAELILDADSPDNALAFFGYDFADSASEAVQDVMIFNGDDLADLLDAVFDTVDIQRLNGMHINDTCLNALLGQLFGGVDGQAYSIAVGDDGDILTFSYKVSLADLERSGLIIDYRDRVSGKAKVNGAGMITVMLGMVRRTPISSTHWWEAPSFAGVRPP